MADAAVPVAVVPWRGAEAAPAHELFSLDESLGIVPEVESSVPVPPAPPEPPDAPRSVLSLDEDPALEDIAFAEPTFDRATSVDETSVPAEYELNDAHAPMVFDMGVSLGLVQMDIDEWTCEDCIYVSTCAFSGTRRPADCGAFQWRA